MPFADASATAMFSQYVLEYLTPDEAQRLLRDCRRILAPGGVIRLCQTNIRAMVDAYLAGDPGPTPAALTRARRFLALASPEHTQLPVRLFRRGGVQQLFDAPTLEWMLMEAGFIDAHFRQMHEGTVPTSRRWRRTGNCPSFASKPACPSGRPGLSR